MKKIILTYLSFILIYCSYAQNIDEILSKYEEMNGGKENFVVITSMQYNNTFKMNMMGRPIDISSQIFIETGKLYRRQMSPMFGMKAMYSIITDSAGYVYSPGMPSYGDFQGMEGGLQKMKSDIYNASKSKLNATCDADDLIDYKSKGLVAEFLGNEDVDNTSCFKIKLTFKDQSFKTFWIDTKTYLIKEFEIQGQQIIDFFGVYGGPMYDMMMRNIKKQKSKVNVIEYKTVEGIKFPIKYKIQFGNNDIEIENTDIKVNEAIDPKWYNVYK